MKAKVKAASEKKRFTTFDIESKDIADGELKGFTRPFKGALPDDAEPRVLSLDDLISGRARVALGLASEEEESARNALFDEVYDGQRKRGWPGL